MKQLTVIDLVKAETRGVVDRLYGGNITDGSTQTTSSNNIWASQAIFQSLSSLCKVLLMRVLYLTQPFSLRDFSSYLTPAGEGTIASVVEELSGLWVIVPYIGEDDGDRMDIESDLITGSVSLDFEKKYLVNPAFQSSFQQALVAPTKPWEAERLAVSDPAPPNLADMDRICSEKWNKLLGLIVGLVNRSAFQTKVVVPFVLRFGLMAEVTDVVLRPGVEPDLTITAKGYEYMLKDTARQVWDFVIEAVGNQRQPVETLSFLFMLSYAEYGRGYPVSALTRTQKQLMWELSEVGILYLGEKRKFFYPTNTAIKVILANKGIHINTGSIPGTVSTTISGDGSERAVADKPLQIIVETNLQVTAYVSNPLHLALLRLFVEVHVLLPNMAIGRLTRDKSKAAFRTGMRAKQIIDFLAVHAHPKVQDRENKLPDNAIDQLVLWEKELTRMQFTEAIVVDCSDMIGMTPEMFQDLINDLQYAKYFLWASKSKLQLACHPDAAVMVDRFLRDKFYR